MKFMIILVVLFGVSYAAPIVKRQAQDPKVWSALDELRGKSRLSIDDITTLFVNSKAGEDYPNLAAIPETTSIDCSSVKPGFYADMDTKCQVVRRCDVNGNASAYLCPNMTIFNQITLVCDWFWNVDCSKSKQFYDYSNSRLYKEDAKLLDDEPEYVSQGESSGEAAPSSGKSNEKSAGSAASKGKTAAAAGGKASAAGESKSKAKNKVAAVAATTQAPEEETTQAASGDNAQGGDNSQGAGSKGASGSAQSAGSSADSQVSSADSESAGSSSAAGKAESKSSGAAEEKDSSAGKSKSSAAAATTEAAGEETTEATTEASTTPAAEE